MKRKHFTGWIFRTRRHGQLATVSAFTRRCFGTTLPSVSKNRPIMNMMNKPQADMRRKRMKFKATSLYF